MGWEDIEEMPTSNLREELLALLNKELEYALPSDATVIGNASSSDNDGEGESLEETRRAVCQWNYECVDYFLFDREVVYLSMHYFDRYLARYQTTDEEGIASSPSTMLSHLLALSALYVAGKLHGVTVDTPGSQSLDSSSSASGTSGSATLHLQDFCNMSRGMYCPQMLQEMELSLLTSLQWKLHPPTPTDFLIRFVKIFSLTLKSDLCGHSVSSDADNVGKGWSVFEIARYQIELAVYCPELCQIFLPSKVALAAVLNAMNSKIVRTKRAIIPSYIRRSFLQHVKCLGGGLAELDFEGEDIVQACTILKALCSKTIVLPGQIADDLPLGPGDNVTFAPIATQTKSFEYELSEVISVSGSSSSTSPVSVATDHF